MRKILHMDSTNTKYIRPSWDQYGLALAYAASIRSQDPYCRVGAAAVREDHSVAGTGYNGPPPGIEISWDNRDERRKYVCHAEINCLRYSKPSEVHTLYVTLSPCSDCIKTIGAFGISRVVYSDVYDRDNNLSFDIAKVYGITLDRLLFNPEILTQTV
jgi:dCMP deaminase